MATSVTTTPWWEALKIRPEILGASGQIEDVQMSLFGAVHGFGESEPPYAEAAYYGEITHPADRLTDLLAEIAVRIGGGPDQAKARAVTRLDQGMGGGKSHACIGAYHLAANPKALLGTELGRRIRARAESKAGRALPDDLDAPRVVVLPCDNMTPGAPVRDLDGPAISLYERFLWRLFSADYSLFDRYRPFFSDKSKVAEAIQTIGRPLLIIVDEVLDYVGNGLDGAAVEGLVAQDMAFLRALLDAVNDVPNVAMLVVMIASERDTTALSAAGRERRDDLSALLERNGTPATVTEVGDFADILRRRLFEAGPAAEVVAATAESYRPVLEDKMWTRHVWEAVGSGWRGRFEEGVSACYPFHPMLMQTVREEWSQVVGFQRVRSTIRIFAATVFALQRRGEAGDWVPALIGPGDLPLGDSAVREALLGSGLVEDEKTVANYRSLAENEVINNDGTGGTARRQDLERDAPAWDEANPRASERAATAIFLASIVGTLRPGRGRGASAPEVKASTSVPDLAYSVTDADTVVEALVDEGGGMSALETAPGQGNNKPARYFLSTRLTHRMLVSNIRSTITASERDETIADFARRLSSTGPFREVRFVRAEDGRTSAKILSAAGLDTAHTSRLVVLDPAQFTLRNGKEDDTVAALSGAMGLGTGTEQLPVQWASSAVYAVANTQRRALARNVATEYLARRKALEAPEVQQDEELRATGQRELSRAEDQLERTVKRAFQHVCYLAQPDPEGGRHLDQVTLEDERSSALDGTIVWKALAERDKAFDRGEFGADALVHNLREADYGRTLSELRAAFYQAPRLPLLYGGDADLRQAVYDAVDAGSLEIVDGRGEAVAVTAPNEVNLVSAGLRLAKPRESSGGTDGGTDGGTTGGTDGGGHGGTEPGGDETGGRGGAQPPARERNVSLSFNQALPSGTANSEGYARLFRSLYAALDEGKVSYLQGTLQVVLDAGASQELQEELERVGIRATFRDQ